MAFPSLTFTGDAGDLDVFIPAVWGSKINDIFRKSLVMGNFFTDRSDELSGGGNIVYTPNITEMTANSKTNGAAVTLNSPTENAITLTVNTWSEVSFAIEDREKAFVKNSYHVQSVYASNAAYTVAKGLDTALANLFSSFTSSAGASTTVLLDSDIRKAIGILEAANINVSSDCAFFIDAKVFWNHVQNVDKFALAQNSPSQDPVMKRPSAYLYGIPVYISNQVPYVQSTTGRYNALAHKDAIHYATSPLGGVSGVRTQANYIPEYLSTLVTCDLLYGVIMNRAGSGVKLMSSAVS